MKRHLIARAGTALVLVWVFCVAAVFVPAYTPAEAQDDKTAPSKSGAATPAFSEADAVRILGELRQGVESDNPRRFLKPFDAKKMPGFAAFRDQISEFFETYAPIRINYHVTQVTTDGDFGAAVVEITLDGPARQGGTANLRRTVPSRAVFGWDGKTWKIVDWSPREMFR
jgi:hypothetical protein